MLRQARPFQQCFLDFGKGEPLLFDHFPSSVEPGEARKEDQKKTGKVKSQMEITNIATT